MPNIKHGMHKTKEYHAWQDMKARCKNPNLKNYKNYGGRGIKVCDEWINSFKKFFEDVGPCPEDKSSLDRKNTNGDYCKENCQWATFSEQILNRRKKKNRVIDLPVGVKRSKSKKERYEAYIYLVGVKDSLGTFDTVKEARDKYCKVFYEWHGKYPIDYSEDRERVA